MQSPKYSGVNECATWRSVPGHQAVMRCTPHRWPPHINLLYPFYGDTDDAFETAAQCVRQALAQMPPFEVCVQQPPSTAPFGLLQIVWYWFDALLVLWQPRWLVARQHVNAHMDAGSLMSVASCVDRTGCMLCQCPIYQKYTDCHAQICLEKLRWFEHGKHSSTLWLDPASEGV